MRKFSFQHRALSAAIAAAFVFGLPAAMPSLAAGLPASSVISIAEAAEKDEVPIGYVQRTVKPVKQKALKASELQIPKTVTVTDPKLSKEAAGLYGYLQGVANSPYLLYGHQNELHKKSSPNLPGASDTVDMVGDTSAVMGFDALALTGNELSLTPKEKAAGITLPQKLASIYIPAAKKGAVLTMSAHMPNFSLVAGRKKIDGKYDFGGYSPNVLKGDVVARIQPGGDLNEVYRAYLDLIADFDSRLQAAGVPLLFRPFHENDGAWFWWGASTCTPSQYKNLYRYTVDYLRNVKGLHNLLIVYSPNGPVRNEEGFLSRYPGDAWVDVIGIDTYHRYPTAQDDGWMKGLDSSMAELGKIAAKHQKVAVLAETGIIATKNGCLPRTRNQRPDWFREVLNATASHPIAYMLTWSNFDRKNYCEPFMVTKHYGHELVDGFTRFYNEKASVFGKQNLNYMQLSVAAKASTVPHAYFLAPGSFDNLKAGSVLRAAVPADAKSAQILFTAAEGGKTAALPLARQTDGTWTLKLNADQAKQLGQNIGLLTLDVDGQKADAVKVLANMPAPKTDPWLGDDFDGYYGDNDLLAGVYSKNCASNSDVTGTLSDIHSDGKYGLAFHYHIGKDGYAGMVKSLKGANWQGANAVEIWFKPDGKGQRFILQVNCAGQDFEKSLSAYTKSTEPMKVRIPFTEFIGKQGGKFDPSLVQHLAFYCNTVGNDTVDSTIYIDAVRAVK